MTKIVTVQYPELRSILDNYEGGLLPYQSTDGSAPFLIIKAPKEFLLTAKIRGHFKIYLVPDVYLTDHTCGLVTAFFDDADEPLVIKTLLAEIDIKNRKSEKLLIEILESSEFDVHFVDDHNREFLGYRAKNDAPTKIINKIKIPLISFSHDNINQYLNHLQKWFGLRTAADDADAITISLKETLMPLDIAVIDLTAQSNVKQSNQTNRPATLERENPGPSQESDILRLLQRSFHSDAIFLNPVRLDNNKEICDILVITTEIFYFIQAKDNQNTGAALNRKLERKRAKTKEQIAKASRQIQGAIRYWKNKNILEISVNGESMEFETTNKKVVGLIVVGELFEKDTERYLAETMDLWLNTEKYCLILDYSDLHRITANRGSEDDFIAALDAIIQCIREEGRFPRLSFTAERIESFLANQ
ncbi:MAG: hypothetical protein ABIS50_11055 [Luteolibacter sp.]|uniref:hypothetical protein n=1 Tax=Luteolibacter sp. TaxID=1962973 RepID=UPI0032634A5C